MKFNAVLRLNANPDWAPHYLAYSNLKKLIYQVEKAQAAQHYGSTLTTADASAASLAIGPALSQSQVSDETAPLLTVTSPGGGTQPEQHLLLSPDAFIQALDADLDRIVAFYLKTEKALYEQVEKLRSDIHYAESAYLARTPGTSRAPSRSRTSSPDRVDNNDHENDNDEHEHALQQDIQSPRAHHAQVNVAIDTSPLLVPGGLSSATDIPPPVRTPTSPMRAGDPALAPVPLSESPIHHSAGAAGSLHLHHASSPDSPLAASSRRASAPSGLNAVAPSTPARSTFSVATSQYPTSIPGRIWMRRSMQPDHVRLGRLAIDTYVSLCDLREYIQLNHTGFAKILKKFAKVTGHASIRADYLARVGQAYPFAPETKQFVDEKIGLVERLYAHVMATSDVRAAVAELKANLRQHVAFERNTVWRDMVTRERQHQAIAVPKPEGEGGEWTLSVPGTAWTLTIPRPPNAAVSLVLGMALFAALLNYRIFETDEQQACFAILISASWLWATEALPLFVTALLIPLSVVLLRVLRDPVTLVRLDPHAATKFIFGAMFSPVIMLLLGGFSIAAALSKHFIAKIAAVSLLAKAGTKTVWVLLANMMVATFASMWISNVAAPVLCFSIIQPILRTLPPNSSFGPALILGIALASNIGGMASPISSPQNVVAIENMHPSPTWAEWFLIAIPMCILTNIITWVMLLVAYKPHVHTPEIVPLRHTDEKLSAKQWFIIGVTLLTIVLWCVESAIESWVGDMGIIALVPIVVFFGSGVLNKDDFNNFLWSVIMLAMGLCPRHVVWGVLFTFSALVLVVATFISHTVAALIVLPIVAEVGNQMADPHPRLLVMGAALMCSGAMGLPISGFPNMNAISQEDATGKPYLRTWDFVKVGVPASVGVWLAILTMGYGTMWYLAY
ncbi:SPX domain-domain-containing protein [Catenaria anguillulae PL171]|uniref:SPX domain-domain-containing protein n=1 Tax=Catenaria anguillulae PL171 TaxID=765915 RepID=A0A1Y2HXW9_9FUNG|nr:SPX domain-domain-containing protein [Catenaria anguillulae PL171]